MPLASAGLAGHTLFMSPELMVIIGLLAGGALFLVGLTVLISVSGGRRLGRFQRRHAYETECVVKSIQTLERAQKFQAQRIDAMMAHIEKLTQELDRRKRGPEEAVAPLPSARILH